MLQFAIPIAVAAVYTFLTYKPDEPIKEKPTEPVKEPEIVPQVEIVVTEVKE